MYSVQLVNKAIIKLGSLIFNYHKIVLWALEMFINIENQNLNALMEKIFIDRRLLVLVLKKILKYKLDDFLMNIIVKFQEISVMENIIIIGRKINHHSNRANKSDSQILNLLDIGIFLLIYIIVIKETYYYLVSV